MYCYNCMSEIEYGSACKNCLNQREYEPAPHHLKPGQVLNNKYLVGNSIGEGGFGITYIGRDMVLDIKVAIKEFFPNGYVNRNNTQSQDVTATTQQQKDFFHKGKMRFLAEAKNIAKFIGEPGIVGVREYFEANGTAYIIMDYLDGTNLSRYVREHGRFDSKKMFELMLPIMRSLKNVHDAGIVHRDISPDNIMYMKNGTLKLMDFGSARYFTNEEKEMSVMLKQGYAPEEQYRKNGHQGPWTDVYGLCATIYRCITGVVPEDALDRVHNDTLKKPSELGVSISTPLELVLMYGLSVYKESRYKNMSELENSVKKAITMGVTPAKPAVAVAPAVPTNVDRTVRANRPSYDDNFTRGQYTDMPAKKKKSHASTIVGVLLIVATLIFALGAFFYFIVPMINDTEETTAPTETVAQTEPTQTDPPETKPSETEVQKVKVPDVKGKSLADATEKLTASGLKVEEPIYVETNDVKNNHVVSQYPNSGSKVEPGTTVTIYVAKPAYTEPQETITVEDDTMSEAEVDEVVESIREYYYDTGNADATVVYEMGDNDVDLRREYTYRDGELIFAFLTDGENEMRLYFHNDKLVRYIDEYGDTYNDGELEDYYGIELYVINEAYGEI